MNDRRAGLNEIKPKCEEKTCEQGQETRREETRHA